MGSLFLTQCELAYVVKTAQSELDFFLYVCGLYFLQKR
jgi:hypothetical protein